MSCKLNVKQLIVPNYVKNFQCKQCGRCCRRSWRIDIDKATYLRVEQWYKEHNILEKLTEKVEADEKGWKIKFDAQNQCAYLTEDNRCGSQLEMGEDYLSDTCKIYPRKIYASSRGIEFSLYFSCPAAAELLLQAAPVAFSQLDYGDANFDFMPPRRLSYYLPEKLPSSNIKRYYYMIESGLIQILQERRLTIKDRLFAICQVCGRLEALDGTSQPPEVVSRAFSSISSMPIDTDYELHLSLLRQSFAPIMNAKREVRECASFLFKILAMQDTTGLALGIMKGAEGPMPLHAEVYRKQLEWYYSLPQENANRVWENYFVNYIFSKEFYIADWKTAIFKMMLLRALIQFYAVALQTLQPKAAPEQVLIQAIVEVDALISHSSLYVQDLCEDIQNNLGSRPLELALNLAYA